MTATKWIWRPTIRGPVVTCARCGAPATGVDPDRAARQAAHVLADLPADVAWRLHRDAIT